MSNSYANTNSAAGRKGGGLATLARGGRFWFLFAVILFTMPFIFESGFALTLMSQMGIAIIFSLSYNMLLGQGGMLSFGHAVFYGLGAFASIHALGGIGEGRFLLPIELLPIVGAATGLFFGALLGYVSTKRSGTAFAMITLGIGELISACALMFTGFFGGEQGISADRMVETTLTGVRFAEQTKVYYLIASWVLVSAVIMFFLTRTPLGRMANAVRDNAERAQFVGYDPEIVRFFQAMLSGGFAGIAGALLAINYEIVTSEAVGAVASGNVLLMTFIGGVGHFFGPILGATLITGLEMGLAKITEAWLLYIGLFFLVMVLYAPQGLAGIIMMHEPIWQAGKLHRLAPSYLRLAATGITAFAGSALIIEMNYHLASYRSKSPMKFFGIEFFASSWEPYAVAALMIITGIWLMRLEFRNFKKRWREIKETQAERSHA